MHNLTANRDSITSLKIAEESTKIAHETRRDSISMKMIAKLTMSYLPATFACSFFGTNFFALPGPAELCGFQTLAGVCCDCGSVNFVDI
jgi:Mg2+ and Co2+ transporter CorA